MDELDSAVKATLNLKISEKRRLNIGRHTTFSELKQRVRKRFPLLQQEHINIEISWNDPSDKSEPVSVSSEEEWRDILADISSDQLLNLNVTVSIQDLSYSSTRPPSVQSRTSIGSRSQKDSFLSETSLNRTGPPSFESSHANSVITQASDDLNELEEESVLKSSAGCDTSDSSDSADIPTRTVTRTQVTFQFSGDDPHTEQQNVVDDSRWPQGDGDTLSLIKIKKPEAPRGFYNTPTYALRGKKKGRLLVINNKTFDNLPEIKGTDFDATSLSILFKQLGFDVKSLASQSIKKLRENLEKEEGELKSDGGKYGCFCAVFLTHCENGGICGTDGNTMSFDEVMGRFNEVLHGKPKIFFAEGLRPDGQQTESSKHCPVQNQQLLNCTGSRDETDSNPSIRSDIFFYVAGTLNEGLPSIKGSLMIQALVKVMCENAHTDSLKEIIHKSQILMDRAVSKSYRFRMPKVYHDSLRKDIHFV